MHVRNFLISITLVILFIGGVLFYRSRPSVGAVNGSSSLGQDTFDLLNRKTSMIYPEGSVVSCGYTGRNQINGINDGGTQLVEYSYNLNGDRIQKALNNGTSTEKTPSTLQMIDFRLFQVYP